MPRYGKLVRDRIPEIIEGSGKQCTTRVISGEDLLAALKAKLLEEVHEFLSENNPAELADVLEVVDGLAQHMGLSMEDLLREKEAKKMERGGFTDGVWLESVD